MSPKIIFLIGRPGCGKGTQLDFLIKETGFEFIKTGAELRKRAKNEDAIGRRINEALSSGKLIPTPLVFMIWMPLLIDFHEREVEGVVFDGNPRKLYEAKMLEEVFEMFEWDEIVACHIHISEEEAYERLKKRGRSDDTGEDIKERLSWFKDEVEPVIEHFRERGSLVEVNGENSVEGVWEELRAKLKPFLEKGE